MSMIGDVFGNQNSNIDFKINQAKGKIIDAELNQAKDQLLDINATLVTEMDSISEIYKQIAEKENKIRQIQEIQNFNHEIDNIINKYKEIDDQTIKDSISSLNNCKDKLNLDNLSKNLDSIIKTLEPKISVTEDIDLKNKLFNLKSDIQSLKNNIDQKWETVRSEVSILESDKTILENNISKNNFSPQQKIEVETLLFFVNNLISIENQIIPSALNIPDEINNIRLEYESTQKSFGYNLVFRNNKGNWIESRAIFFNDFYKVSKDIQSLNSSKTNPIFFFNQISEYDNVYNQLRKLNSSIDFLKFEEHKKMTLEIIIDSNIAKIQEQKRSLLFLGIALWAFIALIPIFALIYIFVLSNKKKNPAVVDYTISKFLDGRTLLIFNSKKLGTLIHPKELEVYADSDLGLKRELNEDSIGVTSNKDGSKSLFVLADGMGGHNAGEVASKIAVQTVIEEGKRELINTQNLSDSDIREILRNIVYKAHEDIIQMSKANSQMANMGTTLETVFLDRHHIYYAHVGDSRIYIIFLEEQIINRVTTDHSELGIYMKRYGVTESEARTKVPSNVITQAVGITSVPLNPDIGDFNISKNNWILLCSDGLSDMAQDDELIGKIVIQTNLDAKGKISELIRVAKEMGGKDNISIILFRRR